VTAVDTPRVVDRFAADYFVREGLTPGRQRDVLKTLAAFEAHAGRPPELCTDAELRAFVTYQVAGGWHVNTVRKHLNQLKPFFRWAWQERIVDADTYMRIREVKPPRGAVTNARPRPYKPREIHRFWDALDAKYPLSSPNMVDRFSRGKSRYNRVWRHGMHLQTQAIVSLALFGGLRAQEIRLADIDEIHPDNDFIVVSNAKSGFGEGSGYREVPYTVQGRQMVAEWLAFRALCNPSHDRPWLKLAPWASPNNALGAGHPFEPLSRHGWDRLMPAIPGGWELHRFRHTCATEWLRAGVRLERVRKLLGHSKLEQTLCYAELVPEDVRSDVRRAEEDFLGAVGRRFDQLVK
jgi:integrase